MNIKEILQGFFIVVFLYAFFWLLSAWLYTSDYFYLAN